MSKQHTSNPKIGSKFGYVEEIPFLRISIVDNSTDKVVKLTPTWFRGVNFITHLFDKVREQTEVICEQIDSIRPIFEHFYAKNHLCDGVKLDENDEVHLLRTANLLVKQKKDEEEYLLDIRKYLLSWDEHCMPEFEEFKDVKQQPSFSTKLAHLQDAFDELHERVVMYCLQ